MYSLNGNNIIIPMGCIDDIWQIHPIKEDYIINFGKHDKLNFPQNSIKPYDYQDVKGYCR